MNKIGFEKLNFDQNQDLYFSRFFFFTFILYLFYSHKVSIYSDISGILFNPTFVYKWLGFPRPQINFIEILKQIWLVLIFFSAIGFLTRISVITSFIIGFYILGLDWAFYYSNHQYQTLIICWGILAFSNSGQAISVDSKITKNKKWTNESGFLKLAQGAVCAMYFIAAISKIRHSGIHFFTLENSKLIMALSKEWFGNRTELQIFFEQTLMQNNFLLAAGIFFSFASEILCPLALILKSKMRYIFILNCIALQILVYLFLNISFLKMAPVFIFWIPWAEIGNKFLGWLFVVCGIRWK